MTETAQRYRKVADQFTERVRQVPDGAWDNPSPCPDWVARDVVRHVVETSRYFLNQAGVEVEAPSVDEDPLRAWCAARDAVVAALEDPAVASRQRDTAMGSMTLDQLVGLFGVGDVLVHTWDLARATGLDERLDPEEVRRVHAALQPNEQRMRGPAFGPKVEVPEDADEQTKFLAFTGRRP